MAAEEVDIVVVGLGPGGESVAGSLARAGLSVVGVNSGLVGGECPYYACIPTKMMLRAATALGEAGRVRELAGHAEVRADWTQVADRVRDEATTDWDDRVAVERFESTGGRFVRGTGRITAPGEVTVSASDGDRVFRARRGIVLNPGSEPAVPPIEGLSGTPYWTNRDAVKVTDLPSSLTVLGGGPVGMEFSQVFARFGVQVTVVESHSRLLARGEPEASECIAEVFDSEGIRTRLGVSGSRVKHDDDGFTVELDTGESLASEQLLVATGRRTDLAALGVAAVGVAEDARSIPVDGRLRAADRVWAIGDATGVGAFTHTSMYQARIVVNDVLGRDGAVADYRAMPAVTFTDPEVAMVGLTESAAEKQGLKVRTALTRIPSSPRGWIHKAGNAGLIKLVADEQRGVLVGATVVAPAGGEILGALAVAVHGEVPVRALSGMILAYPTFHRAVEPALDDLLA